MKLTCVTAVFNAIKAGNRDRLIRCVESVAQLKTAHEHLIYDGASTDGTVELLRELEAKTSGLKVVSEPDTGIYNALNKGLRDARGEWFYVLGADDYLIYPEVLDEYLCDETDGADVLAATMLRSTAEELSHDYSVVPYFNKITDLKGIFWVVPIGHQGELIRTSLARNLGFFDERFRIAADAKMFLLAHDAGVRFKYLFRPFSFFSYGGESEKEMSKAWDDLTAVFREFWRISEKETLEFRSRGFPPFHIMVRYLFHRDRAFRMSARCMMWKCARSYIRLLFYPLVVATRPIRSRI